MVRLMASFNWRLMTASCSGAESASRARERVHFVGEAIGRNHAIDEPDAFGLVRVDDLGEEREFFGAVQPDEPGQDPGTAEVEHEPALGEDLGEARRLRGDHEITAEREVAPGARGDAVDRGDRRDRQLVQAKRGAPDHAHRRDCAAGTTQAAVLRRAREVGARTERVAGAGDDEHAVGAVQGDLVEEVDEALPHLERDRVLTGRTIDREPHHAVVALDEQSFHRHGRYRNRMGMNPFRPHVKRRSDIVLVAAALLVVALLVVWAALPR